MDDCVDLSRSVTVIKQHLRHGSFTQRDFASVNRAESAGKKRKTLLTWLLKQQKSLTAQPQQTVKVKPEPQSSALRSKKRRKRSRCEVKSEPRSCKKVKAETTNSGKVARSTAFNGLSKSELIPSAQCHRCTCRTSQESVARALAIAKSAPSYGSGDMVSRGPLKDEIFQRSTLFKHNTDATHSTTIDNDYDNAF